MNKINPEDIMSVGDLSTELGLYPAGVKELVKDITPVLTTRNGKTPFYDKNDVIKALFVKNERLLTFMGYKSPEESYDVVTGTDA